MLQVSGIHWAGGEIQVHRSGIYEWRKVERGGRWIDKANAVFRFIALWSQNGSFQAPQSSQFLNRSFSDPFLWSWTLGNDRNDIISVASGRDGIFTKSAWCDTSRHSAQLWNSQSPECGTTSPNWESKDILVRACVQNAPRMTDEARPATGVARGGKGAMATQIFKKYSHFVVWEAFFQTK